jgi:hypothetical protein
MNCFRISTTCYKAIPTLEFQVDFRDSQLLQARIAIMCSLLRREVRCESERTIVLGRESNVDELSVILIEMRAVAIVKAELEFFFLFNIWC